MCKELNFIEALLSKLALPRSEQQSELSFLRLGIEDLFFLKGSDK